MSERKTRRVSCEIATGEGRPPFPVAGNRPVHLHWPRLATHFQGVLLAPQRRSDGQATVWSWQEPAGAEPPTPAELAAVRRRLETALAAAQSDLAAEAEEQPGGTAAQLLAVLLAMVGRLVRLKDAPLAAYLARTESGLMVHSWGAAQPAVPHVPAEAGYHVSGVIVAGDTPAAGLEVVIENRKRVCLARTTSDAAGAFLFKQIGSGSYRVLAKSDRLDFPASGIELVVDNQPVSGLVLRSRSLNVATEPDPEPARDPDSGHASAEPEHPASAPTPPSDPDRPRLRRRGLGLLLAGGALGLAAWGARQWVDNSAVASRRDVPAAENPAGLRPGDDGPRSGARPSRGAPAQAGVAAGGGLGIGAAAAAATPAISRESGPPDRSRLTASSGIEQGKIGEEPLDVSVDGAVGHATHAPAGLAAAPPPAAESPENRRAVSARGGAAQAAAASNAEPATIEAAPSDATVAASAAPAQARASSSPAAASIAAQPAAAPAGGAEAAVASGAQPTTTSGAGAGEGAARGGERSASVAGGAAAGRATATPAGSVAASAPAGGAGASGVVPAAPSTAEELSHAARPAAGAPVAVGAVEWRIQIKGWETRLVRDVVLPTMPVKLGEADGVADLRSAMLADLRKQLPTTLRQFAPRYGVRVEIPAQAHRAAGNEARAGAAGEWTLPAGAEALPRSHTLRDAAGRPLAEVTVEADGNFRIVTPAGIACRFWVRVDLRADDKPLAVGESDGSRLVWRAAPNQPLSADCRQRLTAAEAPSIQLDLPLSSSSPHVLPPALALVDRTTGWAAVADIVVQRRETAGAR